MNEKLLNIEEVARYLNLSEQAVKELVGKGDLPAYKIGGVLLRFKKEQIESYRKGRASDKLAEKVLLGDSGLAPGYNSRRPLRRSRRNAPKAGDSAPYAFWERLEDALYYNDFYILSAILLALILLAFVEF